MADAAERLLAWARADAPGPCADPRDRLVLVESFECRQRLNALLEAAGRDRRRLTSPLAVPPRLLPPA